MRILAIETSGQRGSLAILHGEADRLTMIGQSNLTADRRTAQSLAPTLQALLTDAAWAPNSIDLVSVAVGPGSFTGLRIGVTTAKTFAYAANAEIVGVNTLAILAHQAPPSAAPLWAIMDAQRGELFAARFSVNSAGELAADRETSILTQDAWLAGFQPGDRVTGPATRRILARLPDTITLIPDANWQPTAEAVGYVGWRAHQAGQRDDIWKLVPHYYRQSAAEEKAMARDQQK
jgi:tRNA threonylcarbamoyladenosine biosynthesis protein TsaB